MRASLEAALMAAVLMLPAHPWGLSLFFICCCWQIYRRTPRPDRYLKWPS
ncbi:hypothetical protein C8D03_2466 [Bosea sp. 124]|nr:hypothetical protein C8D03_2466 [Bosea sp. 124]